LIEAILEDWRTAPVNEKLRVTLAFLETLTLRPDEVSPEEIQTMRRAGVSDEGIEEAITVCAVFNLADRIADSFDYVPPGQEQASAFGEMRLARGYTM
jgi:alkylhydroperoxidase family enzyme